MVVELATAPPTRRLTAVLLADVVGYSRMMSGDEDTIHSRLTVYARELVDPTIARHRGRYVRSMGDGMLVEFPSALEAVRCAIDVQRGLAAHQSDEPNPIQLRVGINTGDVLVDERDIYGNSVNITARLEALAMPGAVCVSQNIYDQTRGQPGLFFADRGWHRVKNFPYPIRVFEASHEPIRASHLRNFLAHKQRGWIIAAVMAAVALALAVLNFADGPKAVARTNTILVLPFRNIDGKMDDNYLADAITEELTTELSRLRRAWVIASTMAFTYKDKTIDVRQIGREIGVRYALQGSVRRTGAVVYVNTQLIDTESGIDLWGDRFAYETTSLYDLQDAVIRHIGSSLHDEVMRADVRHEVGTLAADGNPLDQRLRTMSAKTGTLTPEKLRDALHYAEQGLIKDPLDPKLMAHIADTILSAFLNSWSDVVLPGLDRPPQLERARELAERAIELNPNNALAHYDLGFYYRFLGYHEAALRKFQDAIDRDRNFAPGYAQLANELVFTGKPEAAIEPAKEAIRLSPEHQSRGVFDFIIGRAYFVMGQYRDAAEWLAKAVEERPNLYFIHAYLVASYALIARGASGEEERQTFAVTANKEREKFQNAFPAYNLDRVKAVYNDIQYRPLENAAQNLFEGLKRAGLT
ncbi:MAG: tetratricopeptide repeat protein [Acetobacteraceae bacterium]|nr:tetratricopeptide repeat protein [Acetobacteraceae bacterium]